MTENEWAIENIKVTPSIKKRLDALKIHPREPYWDVVKRLLDCIEQIDKFKKHPQEPYDEVIKRLITHMDQQPLTSFDKKNGKY